MTGWLILLLGASGAAWGQDEGSSVADKEVMSSQAVETDPVAPKEDGEEGGGKEGAGQEEAAPSSGSGAEDPAPAEEAEEKTSPDSGGTEDTYSADEMSAPVVEEKVVSDRSSKVKTGSSDAAKGTEIKPVTRPKKDRKGVAAKGRSGAPAAFAPGKKSGSSAAPGKAVAVAGTSGRVAAALSPVPPTPVSPEYP